ncbi:MAG: hypothetical protein OEZ06_06125 [Myxococcales bacterium]|nr:hypothetical protein [Myxococcales bacterium]
MARSDDQGVVRRVEVGEVFPALLRVRRDDDGRAVRTARERPRRGATIMLKLPQTPSAQAVQTVQ